MAARCLRFWCALCLGCSLWFGASVAHAAFPQLTVVYEGPTGYPCAYSTTTGEGGCPSFGSAVQDWLDRRGVTNPPANWQLQFVNPDTGCTAAGYEPGYAPGCNISVFAKRSTDTAGGPDNIGTVTVRARAPYCPENAAGPSGGNCTCNSGYEQSNHPLQSALMVTLCEAIPPPVCPDAGTPHTYTSPDAPNSYTSTGSGRSQTCIGGCLMQGVGGAMTPDGRWFAGAPFTNTGENCTENENDEQPPVACSWPQVTNSAGQCVSPPTTTTPPAVTTNPDGSSTTTGTECNGPTCTTTTTNRDPEGNVTSTTTTQQGINEYCAANPNVLLCADVGSLPGGGSGDGAGTCTGTEAECACQANPSGAGCGGSAAAVGDFREGDGESLTDILGDFRDAALATDVGGAAGAFFTVSVSATCPTWSADIPIIGTITFDQLCSEMGTTALLALRVAFLIVCGFYAFRVAFL